MRIKVAFIFFMALLTFSGLGCDSSSKTNTIKIGLGETVITPEENIKMAGFARSQVATGVHDDLHSRCLVIESSDGTSIALLAIAVVGMNEETGNLIRNGINEKTGIPVENIILSSTHTHSGPNVGSAADQYKSFSAGQSYYDFLVKRCVESAVIAWETRFQGKIGIGTAEVSELGRNRRTLFYGGLHPDPEVCVIKIEDSKGELRGVAFNYGCHPSGLDWQNTLYSEDWPYFAIKGIKDKLGENLWTAYYQSAEGNINVGYLAELSSLGVDMPVRKYEYIEKKGNQMAAVVLDVLPSIKTESSPLIKYARETFDYPLRKSYPVTIEQAEKNVIDAKKALAEIEKDNSAGARNIDNERIRVYTAEQRLAGAHRFYDVKERPETRKLEQHSLRIGDAAFVSFPGEIFAEIGFEIKKQSPFEKTFVVLIAPGPGGYLPTAAEYNNGGYEVDYSIYGPEAEQFCIESSLKLINSLK